MSLENAELTKIAVNTFVTTKMTFANMLAELCERVPGGNVDAVTDALGCDKRIGHRYLKGAIGYGGPCFPRDNVALSFFARQVGVDAALAVTTDKTNRGLADKTVEDLRPMIPRGATVAILGLAYKPHSHVVEESQGIRLAKALANAGARVIAHDPLAREGAAAELRDHALILDTPDACIKQAEFIFVTTPDPVYQKLTAAELKGNRASVTIVDFWRILDKEVSGKPGIRYIPIGRSRDEVANTKRLAALWNAEALDT
jgi:UDPglucose 6-dehydrogenase